MNRSLKRKGEPNPSIDQSEKTKAQIRLEQALNEFMKIAIGELGFTRWTITNYKTIFKRLIEYARSKGAIYLDQLTKEDIREFANQWENLNSRRQMITRIKAIFNILENEGFIDRNPAAPIRVRGNIQKKLISSDQWLTFDEANRLVNACRNIEEKATILFALRTGVRKESLIIGGRIPPQIDLVNRKAVVFEKRQKMRTVYFDQETQEALRQLFNSGRTFPVFTKQQLYAVLAQLGRIAEIPKKITPLTLRHTFACHCRLKGIRLEDLRDLMGHESIQTTLIYANVGETETEKTYRQIWENGGSQ